jgi:cell division protease FtsH
MSRFFKSAAFPILIVVVLAFFAQKLIGSGNHTTKQTFGDLLYQLDNRQVQSMSLHEKDNTANVTTTSGLKYTVGYPDGYVSQLITQARTLPPGDFDIQGKTSSGWLSLLT